MNNLTELEELVPKCFGETDLIFNSHPLDVKKSIEINKMIVDNILTKEDVLLAFFNYLHEKGCTKEHISQQMNRVRLWLGFD